MNLQLGLRQGRYHISLIGVNSRHEPPIQFGLSYPNSRNPYADIITAWGGNPDSPRGADSPRGERSHTIDIPIDKRTQTFLSHQVSPELAQQLRGGLRSLANNGRQKGNTTHRVEVNTHRNNQLSIHQRTHRAGSFQPNFGSNSQSEQRQQMRESIVTHLAPGGYGTMMSRRMSTYGNVR